MKEVIVIQLEYVSPLCEVFCTQEMAMLCVSGFDGNNNTELVPRDEGEDIW